MPKPACTMAETCAREIRPSLQAASVPGKSFTTKAASSSCRCTDRSLVRTAAATSAAIERSGISRSRDASEATRDICSSPSAAAAASARVSNAWNAAIPARASTIAVTSAPRIAASAASSGSGSGRGARWLSFEDMF